MADLIEALRNTKTAAEVHAIIPRLEAEREAAKQRLEALEAEREEAILKGSVARDKLRQQIANARATFDDFEAASRVAGRRHNEFEAKEAMASLDQRSRGFGELKRKNQKAYAKIFEAKEARVANIERLKAELKAAETEGADKIRAAEHELHEIASQADQINEDAARLNRPDLFVSKLPYSNRWMQPQWEKDFEHVNQKPFSFRDSEWFYRLSSEEKEAVIAEREPQARARADQAA